MSDDTVVIEVYAENNKQENFDSNADQADIKAKLLKCGEIYTLDNVNYILVCNICEESFLDALEFGNHYRGKHPPLEQNTPPLPIFNDNQLNTPIVNDIEPNAPIIIVDDNEPSTPPAVDNDNVEEPSEEKEGNGNADLDFLLSEYKMKEEDLPEPQECIELSSDDDSSNDNIASNHQNIMQEELSQPKSNSTSIVSKPMYDFNCKLCGSPLQNDESLREHLIHQHKFIECVYCKKICINQTEFKTHFATHNCDINNPNRIRQCRQLYYNLVYDNRIKKTGPKCRKTVPSSKNRESVLKYRQKIYQMLKRHSKQHSSAKKFKCPDCDTQFETLELLKTHQNAPLHFSFTYDC